MLCVHVWNHACAHLFCLHHVVTWHFRHVLVNVFKSPGRLFFFTSVTWGQRLKQQDVVVAVMTFDQTAHYRWINTSLHVHWRQYLSLSSDICYLLGPSTWKTDNNASHWSCFHIMCYPTDPLPSPPSTPPPPSCLNLSPTSSGGQHPTIGRWLFLCSVCSDDIFKVVCSLSDVWLLRDAHAEKGSSVYLTPCCYHSVTAFCFTGQHKNRSVVLGLRL